MVSINRFGDERTRVFGFSAIFVAGKKLRQYFGIKAFVQTNCGPNKSFKDAENSVPSMIFGFLASNLCQIFIGIILIKNNIDDVSNQS